MTDLAAQSRSVQLPKPELKRTTTGIVMWGILLAALMWSWEGADMRPMALYEDAANMAAFVDGFFPPDFYEWPTLMNEMIVTVQIAVWGTVLSVVCAVPFGILSSENMVPWWVWQPVRRLMDAFRAINEIVFAMLFVVAVGLGPVRGGPRPVDSHHRRSREAVFRGGRGDRSATGSRGSRRPGPTRFNRSYSG